MLKEALVFIACIGLAGCFGGSKEFSIDNPTDKPLSVFIDNKEITIPAGEMQNITLNAGPHQMTLPNGEKVKFSVLGAYGDSERSGIINPTQTRYIYVIQKYVADGVTPFTENGDVHVLKINGEEFTGPFIDLGSELFIDSFNKDWNFGPTESFPETTFANSHDTYKTKLFRANDFIHYYKTDFSPSGDYSTRISILESVYKKPELSYNFSEPELQQNISEALKIYNQFIHADSASKQKDLKKQFEQQNRAKWRNPQTKSLENAHYYEVMSNINHIFWSSVIELSD
ncbi:hypothetical protein [Pragia fontium]|uniref:hypothetical protein n=1 Tax=Pragia fontium TaxID=82985 RepID=UPI000DF95DF2|nr:hypothetical protein [Pragia fontium]SUB82045.1 Uncharacterised protein [Pragia fontium]VEJ54667.1 Uncharacterised protein [Pragia fontium]